MGRPADRITLLHLTSGPNDFPHLEIIKEGAEVHPVCLAVNNGVKQFGGSNWPYTG